MNLRAHEPEFQVSARVPLCLFLYRSVKLVKGRDIHNFTHLWVCNTQPRVYENRILRRIFGPKRHEIGQWRRLHNEQLHSLYRSPNIVRVIKSRRLRWAGYVVRMEEGRSAFKILTGKPPGKRPLGRPRRRWEDNIRMDLEEIGINAANWVDLAPDRNYWRALVNPALNLRVP